MSFSVKLSHKSLNSVVHTPPVPVIKRQVYLADSKLSDYTRTSTVKPNPLNNQPLSTTQNMAIQVVNGAITDYM